MSVDTSIKIPSTKECESMIPNKPTESSNTDTNGVIPPSAESVTKTINESEDLVTALEAVGAMYGIPSSNILIDDSLRSIKVVNENIIAPSNINPSGNAKAIMCSIGAVLDYISQRIDDKLTTFQLKNIDEHHPPSSVRREANPAKGNVVARYVDNNNDEIIVYDTGLVDMANTKEAQRKVEELRQDMKIPMYNPQTMQRPTYFSDEDDITQGLDMNINDAEINDSSMDIETNDISTQIQESHFYMDLMDKFNGTRHLGYDLLTSQGFDFVKPTGEIVQESVSSKKDKKTINPEDIRHMKFDNTNILKAIKYMNDARAEQTSRGRDSWTVKQLINNPNWQKAIDCLNKQFNAHINIRFINDDENGRGMFTSIWNDIKTNITISKSKGFQLNGLSIDIFVINKSIDGEGPKNDPSMFGQFVIAGLLHEIFHNISSALRQSNGEFYATLGSTIALASTMDSAKSRRAIITNYVNTLEELGGKKLGLISKKKLIKQMLLSSVAQHDELMMQELKKKIDNNDGSLDEKEIDDLIRKYEDRINKYNKQRKRSKNPFFKLIRGIGCVVGAILTCTVIGAIIGIPLLLWSIDTDDDKYIQSFRSEKHMEEYFCDLFAGMYKLPIAFLTGKPGDRKFTMNSIDPEKLKKLSRLEKELYEIMCSTYPTIQERTYAAVKIAKTLFESNDKLDPALKKYCQWIIDNHSNILDTDIETDYNDNTFDPKSAEDLDGHLQNLINQNNITLTESDVSWIMSGDVIMD